MKKAKVVEIVKKVEVKDGSILIMKGDYEPDAVQSFFDELLRQGYKNITIMHIDDENDIKTISDEEMSDAGWIRKPNKTPTATRLTYELVFMDGEKMIVKDTTYSRAIVQASNVRLTEGCCGYKQLNVVSGIRRTDLD